MAVWHQTQQHIQASCGTPSFSRVSITPPDNPISPFPTSPSFPRSITSHHIRQNRRYHLGTAFVCMFEPCIYVSLCVSVRERERESKRKKKTVAETFLLKRAFKQLWVEHSRLDPSFSLSLISAHFSSYLKATQNVNSQSIHLQDKVSHSLFYLSLLYVSCIDSVLFLVEVFKPESFAIRLRTII